MTVDASYNYNLTGPNLYTDLVVGASIVEGELWPEVFSINRVADTFVSYPAAGTFSISHQATLLAGHQYLIGYSMRILALGNTGAVGTGDGYVHFTLTPVPEPSAILPLALATMLLRRRRS
ncbi:MAG: PEP-CTERM sorting domain-containing protein [Planctomycetes bacterium]|nr:PEP-CTERM sorting domain-containing protein [Planctomycetota bacterium]